MSVVTVIETTWEIDQVAIKSVRVPVFVEEQHVPYEIDFDDFDATAVQWLAYAPTRPGQRPGDFLLHKNMHLFF